MNKQIKLSIVKVLKYFAIFTYDPTLEEIYTFLPVKISKDELKKELKRMKYTPVEYSILSQKLKPKVKNSNETMKQWNNLIDRQQISKKKLNSIRFKLYIKLVSFFPQIKLIGLSGSISMMNADMDDDIDLFIITTRNRLFTGRLIALILAQLFGLRRSRGVGNNSNKICLNLFFDEVNMKVPRFKQTEFVGHEVLQMKPIINKEMTYERFLASNKWVFKLFPNSKQIFNFQFSLPRRQAGIFNEKLGDWIESNLKSFQMKSINKHKTTEIITSTQLWFHPDDFEKKLPHLDKADSI